MEKKLNIDALKSALQNKGWTQKILAGEIGVTGQSITNWMKGTDFPRPDKLVRLAMKLGLNFNELVLAKDNAPIVAFRKRAGTKTTDDHRLKAMTMGAMLQPLVPYLPKLKSLRTKISSPSMDYQFIQNAVKEVRGKLGIGMAAPLQFQSIVSEFDANDAVIIPVMWGQKTRHENALHILLPSDQVTFIYLNLDTHIEDFKFWMAHELAHVYTPEIAGTDQGEDFADAFAGTLLFPEEAAKLAYAEAIKKQTQSAEMTVLRRYAQEHLISLYSVFCEVQKFAKESDLPLLKTKAQQIHTMRSITRGELVSEILFKPLPPEPSALIASAQAVFQSHFFESMKRMLVDKGTGSGYIQQVLDISMQDGIAIHNELTH